MLGQIRSSNPWKWLRVVALLLMVVGICGGVWWWLRTPTPQFVIHRNIEFAKVDGKSLLLDLYLPTEQNPPPPVIIWLHGGAWQWGDKEHNPLRWLAMEGYAIVTVNYRLSDTTIFPAAIHDCKAVVRWLRASQLQYGFDARRVVAAGSSAGGHLAALLGTTHGHQELEGTVGPHLGESSEVQAIISYSGPADLTLYQDRGGTGLTSAVTKFLGHGPWSAPELTRLASPIHHLDPSDPPMLILHVVGDPVVEVAQSMRLHEGCLKVGIESSLILVDGNEHDSPALYAGQRRDVLRQFLSRHLPRGLR